MNKKRWPIRGGIYLGGLLVIAFGVALSVNSGLGVAPTSGVPYAIWSTLVYHGFTALSLGNCVTLMYMVYVLVQLAVLRRQFKVVNVLQMLVAAVFGYCVDFAKWAIGDFLIPTYFGRLAMLAASVLLIAVGISMYLRANIMPMPTEGMCLAISKKLGVPYHRVKFVSDFCYVTASVVISLLGTGQVVGVREGTIITALAVGPLMGLLGKRLNPLLDRLCFGAPVPTPEIEREIEDNAETRNILP